MRHLGIGRGAAALLLLALSLCGCSSEPADTGPGAAVRQFYDRLNQGDHTGAIALYSAESRGVLDDPAGSGVFGGWAEGETKGRSVAEVRIVSTAEHAGGGGAEVQFEVRYRDGTSVTRQVSLVQEDGAWRLGFIS